MLYSCYPKCSFALTVKVFLHIALFFAVPNLLIGQTVTANKTVAVQGGGNAVPGGQLNYSITVSNTGAAANGVTFTDVLNGNLTLVAGSVKATPIAVNDTYDCIGNLGLTVPLAGSVKANDISPDNTATTVSTTTNAATTQGGTISLAADGSFTYKPAPGFNGTDSYTYTLNSTNGTSGTGTVSIIVGTPVWFINSAAAAGGNGTLASPFNTVNAFQAINDGANTNRGQDGDYIFVYSGSYSSSAITLRASQKLIGQDATSSVAAITGITVPPYSNILPSAGGATVTIANTTATPVTLGSGNEIQGCTITSTSGTAMIGTSVGALKVRTTVLSATAGQALQITAGGALDVQFKSISAAGAAKGISVNSSTGNFQILGTGTTAGSGGTISTITTRGAEFASCTNITLKNMNFTNANTAAGSASATDYSTANGAITLNSVSGVTLTKVAISGTTKQRGITGKTISNFTLDGGSTITDCGDEVNEGCLYLQELTGVCSISDATLSKGAENIARVFNSTGTLTLNIGTDATTTIFNDTQTQNANMASPGTISALRSYCFIYTTSGSSTATATLNVRNTSFLKAGTHGFKVISDGSGTVNANIKNCTLDNENAAFIPNDQGGSVEMTAFNTANLNYNILNNTCRGRDIALINIVAQVSSNAQGRVNNNTITHYRTGSAGEGIRFSAEGNSNIITEAIGNNISGMGFGVGIYAISSGGAGKMNATVINNTITITDANASHNIQIQAGNSSSTFTNTTCANVANNTTTRPDLVNGFNYRVRAVTTAGSTHKVYLQGTGSTSAADVWAFNANTPAAAGNVAQSGTFGTHIFSSTNAVPVSLATCAVVSYPIYTFPQPSGRLTNSGDNETGYGNTTVKTTENTQKTLDAKTSIPVQPGNSTSAPNGVLSGETVTVNGAGSGFSIPGGKSTIITFSATISAAPSSCTIPNQASVSGSNFATVNSNTTSTTLTIPGITSPVPPPSTVCSGGGVTMSASASGGTVNWWTVASGGTAAATGNTYSPTNITVNTSYYASSVIGGCEGTRVLIGAVTVLALPNAAVTATPNPVCLGAVLNLSTSPGHTTYTWSGSGVVLANANTTTAIPAGTGSQAYSVAITGTNGCSNTGSTNVTVNPAALPTVAQTNTSNISGTSAVNIFGTACNLIATVTPVTPNAIAGSVTYKVWVEGTQQVSFVKRHYEITPATNAAIANARVTLYFTQQEFDDFNAVNTVKLPANGTDAPGKANLLIEKKPGTSSDGSGLPGTYSGTAVNINPIDADIVWNAADSRWEISFAVTGFSGFFVKTHSGAIPVRWISISGQLNNQKEPVIRWRVEEQNIIRYELEKSTDLRVFNYVTSVNSKGDGENNYSITEALKLNGTAYYRIKQIEFTGHAGYSAIIRLRNGADNNLSIYPTVFSSGFMIESPEATQLQLMDATGKLIKQIQVANGTNYITASGLPSGIYLVKCNGYKVIKLVKM